MARFHPLTVTEIRRETPDSVSVRLAVPEALRETFMFLPGQYLTLRATIDGEDIRRSYSICSGLDDGDLRVGVKKVADGAFSTFVNENLKAGDVIEVMPPEGRFVARPDLANARHYLGIAAGSGITPILSIAKSILAREPASRFTLIYGNRTSTSVMFAEEIEDLKNRHLKRLSVVHVLSREAQDVPLLSGRINAEKLTLMAERLVDLATIDEAYLCGPEGLVGEVRTALAELGMADERIRVELFTAAAPRIRFMPRAVNGEADAVVSRINVTLDGQRRAFDLLAGDESIIEAAARNGIDLPFSCKGGMCCTCRCKVEAGKADMAVNYSLEPWEIDAGFILGCQARPLTPELSLDFDEL